MHEFKVTWGTLAWRSGFKWSSRVKIFGYLDAVKTCSLMDFKYLISSTKDVNVLNKRSCISDPSMDYIPVNIYNTHICMYIILYTDNAAYYPWRTWTSSFVQFGHKSSFIALASLFNEFMIGIWLLLRLSWFPIKYELCPM